MLHDDARVGGDHPNAHSRRFASSVPQPAHVHFPVRRDTARRGDSHFDNTVRRGMCTDQLGWGGKRFLRVEDDNRLSVSAIFPRRNAGNPVGGTAEVSTCSMLGV